VCSVLQCCCSVLQRVAVCSSVVEVSVDASVRVAVFLKCVAVLLQCVAVCCSMLQCC